MIAQTLALSRPVLVRSLRHALREPARLSRENGMAAIVPLTLERWLPPPFRAARPDILDRAAKSLPRQAPQVHAAMWEMIAPVDLQARLPALRCPTLVVVGEKDVNAPPAAGRQNGPGGVQRPAPVLPGRQAGDRPGAVQGAGGRATSAR